MAGPRWPKHVIRKASLTVALSASAASSGWGPILGTALADINRMLASNKIDLVFSKADKPINAHITIDTMTGSKLHGNAKLSTSRSGSREYLSSVVIAVPAAPRIDENDPKSRLAGDGVRLYLLVHELIHSIGLSNDEHTGGDVFSSSVQLLPGQKAADDKVQFDAEHGSMPPIKYLGATITKIRDGWSIPDT